MVLLFELDTLHTSLIQSILRDRSLFMEGGGRGIFSFLNF